MKQSQDSSEHLEQLTTENEILKTKIQEMETRVNTLSRAGEESRLEDKFRYEKLLTSMNDENRIVNDRLRVTTQQLAQAEHDAEQWKELCKAKDQEIVALQGSWKEISEELTRTMKDYKEL